MPDISVSEVVMPELESEEVIDVVLLSRIDGIDLSGVKHRLCDRSEGPGWSEKKADEILKRYRRFLYLVATNGEIKHVVPTRDIDTVWHMHVLDTRAYFADCERVFGTYLHHDPSFGAGSEAERAKLREAYEATAYRYQRIFREDYASLDRFFASQFLSYEPDCIGYTLPVCSQ